MSKITRSGNDLQVSHAAIIAHGAHPEYRLEFSAPVAADATGIYQGSIVSLNEDGEFVLGAAAGTADNCPVPMVSMKNIADPDVTTGIEGTTWETSTYSAIGGNITAIPVTGGYEIETTEFDVDGTYAANDVLTVGADAAAGKVVKGTIGGTTPVIGFVSKGVSTNNTLLGNKVLAFFTHFIPVTPAAQD